MVAIEKTASPVILFRFWLSHDDFFRVVWNGGCAIGRPDSWEGDEPPAEIEDELRAIDETDPRCVDLVSDFDTLWTIHATSCLCCSARVITIDDLSDRGECTKCFVARVAA